MTNKSAGWYKYNETDLVIVFIHGLFSNSKKCWLNENDSYWPQLIAEDLRYKDPSIYLSEFYTASDSNDYGVQNCAAEVFGQLNRQDVDLKEPPLSKNNILFVTHSAGGIVTRYLLDQYADSFVGKKIGIGLYASPSYGSKLASTIGWIPKLFNHKLSCELSWGSAIIDDLDGRFRHLLESKKLDIYGFEVYENKSLFHIPYLNNSSRRLVGKESAARYFGMAKLAPDSSHSSIVKPTDRSHFSHKVLLDFMVKNDFIKDIYHKKGDVLFDQYNHYNDKFYVVRIDDSEITKALEKYSLWVCGPTGVGKTIAIQRAINKRNIGVRYISLSSCLNESMKYIFNDILAGVSDEEYDAEGLSIPDAIKAIAKVIKKHCEVNDVCLMIEEIPIKDQEMFIEFSEYMYTLLLNLKGIINFKLVLSSIYEPADITGGELDKIFESLKVIRFQLWLLDDMNKLVDIIEREIDCVESMKGRTEYFNGSPREAKIHYRDCVLVSESQAEQ